MVLLNSQPFQVSAEAQPPLLLQVVQWSGAELLFLCSGVGGSVVLRFLPAGGAPVMEALRAAAAGSQQQAPCHSSWSTELPLPLPLPLPLLPFSVPRAEAAAAMEVCRALLWQDPTEGPLLLVEVLFAERCGCCCLTAIFRAPWPTADADVVALVAGSARRFTLDDDGSGTERTASLRQPQPCVLAVSVGPRSSAGPAATAAVPCLRVALASTEDIAYMELTPDDNNDGDAVPGGWWVRWRLVRGGRLRLESHADATFTACGRNAVTKRLRWCGGWDYTGRHPFLAALHSHALSASDPPLDHFSLLMLQESSGGGDGGASGASSEAAAGGASGGHAWMGAAAGDGASFVDGPWSVRGLRLGYGDFFPFHGPAGATHVALLLSADEPATARLALYARAGETARGSPSPLLTGTIVSAAAVPSADAPFFLTVLLRDAAASSSRGYSAVCLTAAASSADGRMSVTVTYSVRLPCGPLNGLPPAMPLALLACAWDVGNSRGEPHRGRQRLWFSALLAGTEGGADAAGGGGVDLHVALCVVAVGCDEGSGASVTAEAPECLFSPRALAPCDVAAVTAHELRLSLAAPSRWWLRLTCPARWPAVAALSAPGDSLECIAVAAAVGNGGGACCYGLLRSGRLVTWSGSGGVSGRAVRSVGFAGHCDASGFQQYLRREDPDVAAEVARQRTLEASLLAEFLSAADALHTAACLLPLTATGLAGALTSCGGGDATAASILVAFGDTGGNSDGGCVGLVLGTSAASLLAASSCRPPAVDSPGYVFTPHDCRAVHSAEAADGSLYTWLLALTGVSRAVSEFPSTSNASQPQSEVSLLRLAIRVYRPSAAVCADAVSQLPCPEPIVTLEQLCTLPLDPPPQPQLLGKAVGPAASPSLGRVRLSSESPASAPGAIHIDAMGARLLVSLEVLVDSAGEPSGRLLR